MKPLVLNIRRSWFPFLKFSYFVIHSQISKTTHYFFPLFLLKLAGHTFFLEHILVVMLLNRFVEIKLFFISTCSTFCFLHIISLPLPCSLSISLSHSRKQLLCFFVYTKTVSSVNIVFRLIYLSVCHAFLPETETQLACRPRGKMIDPTNVESNQLI